MSLLAADLSSHNTITSWPAFLGSVDIVIPKISEGTGYLWAGAPQALANARAAGKLIGAYHFFGGGDPVAEANYFLSHYDWRPGEVPILDWEPTAPPANPDAVAYAFSKVVCDALGMPPLIYMNSSTARSSAWAQVRGCGSHLWVAQYGTGTPAVGSWPAFDMWQYTSSGSRPGVGGYLDLSTFYGDANAWRALGTPGADMPLTQQEIDTIVNGAVLGVINRQVDGTTELWQVLRDLHQHVGSASVNVDAASVAAALLADPSFLPGVAKAVNDDAARRLASS